MSCYIKMNLRITNKERLLFLVLLEEEMSVQKVRQAYSGDFDFMHPPAERHFQCQPLIYSTVILRMHRSQADISQNSTNHVIDQPSGADGLPRPTH